MGISFRKSFKIGPVKVNVSKSGVGASVGRKGARIGINAKGNAYVSAGADGVYYRKTLGSPNEKANPSVSGGSAASGGAAYSDKPVPADAQEKTGGAGIKIACTLISIFFLALGVFFVTIDEKGMGIYTIIGGVFIFIIGLMAGNAQKNKHY
jgi:hypothetical protein